MNSKDRRLELVSSTVFLIFIVLAFSSLLAPEPIPEPIEAPPEDGVRLGLEIHLLVRHWRDGILLMESHHPGNLTDLGADWIAGVLGDADGDQGDYIAVTNSTTAYADNWVVLPDEITTDGLARAIGAYTYDSTGAWNISKTYSCTGSNMSRRAGLYHNASGSSLVCSDEYTPVSTQNGDTLEIIWMLSVSDE